MAVDWLSMARVGVSLAFLIVASWQDFKTRTIDDELWIAMGLIGLVLVVGEMWWNGAPIGEYLLLFPIVLLYFDPYIDRAPLYENTKVCWPALIAFIAAGCTTVVSIYLSGFFLLLIVPTMFLLVYLFYFYNIIHGGADAKALMAICLVVPWYPTLPNLPLVTIPDNIAEIVNVSFPFVLLVLMMASLSAMAFPLYNLIKNALAGNMKLPFCFFGRSMNIADAEKSMVWPLERVVEGKVVRALFPKRGRNLAREYEALKAAGVQEVWVTPKIPFIVPITAGFVLATVVGNVVFWVARVIT